MANGDGEWKFGIDGAELFEDYVEKKYGEEIVLPENACGDPVILEISPDIGLLMVNSQWFVSDWDAYEEINEGCAVQSRKGFKWLMTNMVKGLRYKHVLVAMHHPVISRGPRGGEHNLSGIFKDGYLGPLGNWWRSKIGVKQDLYSPKMDDLKDMLEGLFDEHPAVTFVSGHEYLLQFGRFKEHAVVGSGTAVRVDPGKVGQRTVFTAGVNGFAELHYYENGETWVRSERRMVHLSAKPFSSPSSIPSLLKAIKAVLNYMRVSKTQFHLLLLLAIASLDRSINGPLVTTIASFLKLLTPTRFCAWMNLQVG